MSAKVIDGKSLAEQIHEEVRARVQRLTKRTGIVPSLAAVLVGDDPASHVYVRNKRRACAKVGIQSELYQLPADISQAELLQLIRKLNADGSLHGILVQMPLPDHIDEAAVVSAVDPAKDVDGFHPVNLGRLAAGTPSFLPCTPAGIQQILLRSGFEPEGRHVVIVGRSNIVGKPLALILMQKARGANATVTICHSLTRNIPALTRQADIVVVAIGQPRFLTADMVRPGAVVIDVGINRVEGKLVGDVDFDAVSQVASAVTPVPGGVGPMTVAMLLHNTAEAAERAGGGRSDEEG